MRRIPMEARVGAEENKNPEFKKQLEKKVALLGWKQVERFLTNLEDANKNSAASDAVADLGLDEFSSIVDKISSDIIGLINKTVTNITQELESHDYNETDEVKITYDTFFKKIIFLFDRLSDSGPRGPSLNKEYLEREYLKILHAYLNPIVYADNDTEEEKYLNNNAQEAKLEDGFWENRSLLYERLITEGDYVLSGLLPAFEYIKKIGGKESVNVLVDFIKNNPDNIYVHVAQALSEIDPQYAAKKILPLLRDQSPKMRETAIVMLQYLDFGEVQCSAQGAEYLGRVYDLGEYNNPKYFIYRISVDGVVGIFDERKNLIKYFSVGNLSVGNLVEGDDKVKPDLQAVEPDGAFYIDKNNPDADTDVAKDIADFAEYALSAREDVLVKKYNIDLDHLTLKEQTWFIAYLKKIRANSDAVAGVKEQELSDFFKQMKRFGGVDTGVKILSGIGSQGDEYVRKILDITAADKYTAGELFIECNKILKTTDQADQYLQKALPKKTRVDKDAFIRQLLANTKKLVMDCPTEANGEKDLEIKLREYSDQMWQRCGENLIFAQILKQVSREKDFDLTEVANADVQIKNARELHDLARRDMLKIFVANRPNYSAKQLETIKAEFEEAMNNEKSRWYLLYNSGRVVSFMRFDDISPGANYFASFNVSPSMRGSGIGSAFMRYSFDFEGAEKGLEAVVHYKNPAVKLYVGEFGFKITQTIENYHNTGETYYKIERAPKVVPISSARSAERSGRGVAPVEWPVRKAA